MFLTTVRELLAITILIDLVGPLSKGEPVILEEIFLCSYYLVFSKKILFKLGLYVLNC